MLCTIRYRPSVFSFAVYRHTNQNMQDYNFVCDCFFHGCETWSLTLREEHRLRVCENRVLRRIFGWTGGRRKLHNEEPHNLYSM
jgi:hypothetical protein